MRAASVFGGEPELRREPLQDIGDLEDDLISRANRRRRERGKFGLLQHIAQCAHAGLTQDIIIRCARVFEQEAHELTAALDARPVIELIGFLGLFLFGHDWFVDRG